MLKMYHRHEQPGGSSAYWEEFGRHGSLADRVRFLQVDPLRPLFERFLKPGATMLEGGCGRGQYVAYYAARGVNVVGLDFAREWLKRIHAEAPALKLCEGDVGSLPFPDGTFDLYYSGGVVEHFEDGAERALAEARRVLKPGGTLLISVPYYSPMRRVLALARGEWTRVNGPRVDNGDAGLRGRFYQYAYTVREFERFLASAGLRVVEWQGYAILWGLYDVEGLRRFAHRFEKRQAAAPAGNTAGSTAGPAGPEHVAWTDMPLLKRWLVAEDVTAPGGWLVRAGRWACANMMMYVCTAADGGARA